MNVISNGDILCFTTDSNELQPIKAYNTGANDMTTVTVAVTWGSGIVFESYDASQGTFAVDSEGAGTWTIGTLTPAQDINDPETLDLCFRVVDNSLSPFVVTYTIDCAECPDESPDDNTASRTFEGTECEDFTHCIKSVFGCLNEYDNMSDAIAEEGSGAIFLASLLNTEGWSYRSLLVTPVTTLITFEIPDDMVENPCINECDGEATSSGLQLTCTEALPVITGPCDVEALITDITSTEYDEDGNAEFDITYFLPCSDCSDINSCCCTSDGQTAGQFIIVHAVYVDDSGEGELTFTVEATPCIAAQEDSYHYIKPVC